MESIATFFFYPRICDFYPCNKYSNIHPGVSGTRSGMQRITDDDKLEATILKKRDDLLRHADQGDLVNYGIVQELVGRFPVIVPFHSLDKVIFSVVSICFFGKA